MDEKQLETSIEQILFPSNGNWIQLYLCEKTEPGVSILIYPVLVDCKYKNSERPGDWGFKLGEEYMDYDKYFRGNKEYKRYYKEGIEPVVYYFSHHGKKRVEVIEAFKQFFQLDKEIVSDGTEYYFLNDNADRELIIRELNDQILINKEFIQIYLSVVQKKLVLCFDISSLKPHAEKLIEKESDNYSYSFSSNKRGQLFHGKYIVNGMKCLSKCRFSEESEKTVEFPIRLDENGAEIYEFPNEQCYRICFKLDVLDKYYKDPNKYRVSDGFIECMKYWKLPCDTDSEDCVSVRLKDLGYLPYKEQLYWRSFCVPSGTVSTTAIERSVLGEFCNPQRIDWVVRNLYKELNIKWQTCLGWPLFKPLGKNSYRLECIHIPLNSSGNDIEADKIIAALDIVLIESINVKKIKRELVGVELDKDIRSIELLEKHLTFKGFSNVDKVIGNLRLIHKLRSEFAAHKRSSKRNESPREAINKALLCAKEFMSLLLADEIMNTTKS